jgi:hypothetical protein
MMMLQADGKPTQGEVSIRPGGNLTSDETAALLGGYVWKLDVTLPADTKQVTLSLQRQLSGQNPSSLGGIVSTTVSPHESKRDVLVAIVPIGGSISEAEKLRASVFMFERTGNVSTAGASVSANGVSTTVSAGGVSTAGCTGEVENPFRKLNMTQTQNPPERIGNGTFKLISGSKADRATTSTTEVIATILSLRIEASNLPLK